MGSGEEQLVTTKPQHNFCCGYSRWEHKLGIGSQSESQSVSSWLVMDAKSVDRQAGSTAMAQEPQWRCPAIGPGHLGSACCGRRGAPGCAGRGGGGALGLRLFLCAHGVQTRPSRFLPIGGNGLKPVCKRDGAQPCAQPRTRASERAVREWTWKSPLSLEERVSECERVRASLESGGHAVRTRESAELKSVCCDALSRSLSHSMSLCGRRSLSWERRQHVLLLCWLAGSQNIRVFVLFCHRPRILLI